MGWGRAAPVGVAGGLFLGGAGLVLVLLLLDQGVSQDLSHLREQQEQLWESVPGLWQRLAELKGQMEQGEREGWLRLVAAQRLGAELLQLRLEGRRLGAQEAALEAALREELGRLRGGAGGASPSPSPQ